MNIKKITLKLLLMAGLMHITHPAYGVDFTQTGHFGIIATTRGNAIEFTYPNGQSATFNQIRSTAWNVPINFFSIASEMGQWSMPTNPSFSDLGITLTSGENNSVTIQMPGLAMSTKIYFGQGGYGTYLVIDTQATLNGQTARVARTQLLIEQLMNNQSPSNPGAHWNLNLSFDDNGNPSITSIDLELTLGGMGYIKSIPLTTLISKIPNTTLTYLNCNPTDAANNVWCQGIPNNPSES